MVNHYSGNIDKKMLNIVRKYCSSPCNIFKYEVVSKYIYCQKNIFLSLLQIKNLKGSSVNDQSDCFRDEINTV